MPTTLEVQALLRDLTSLGVGQQLASPVALDPATTQRVASFQHDRGLPMSGLVDALTWERLVEGSWELGSRLLFLAHPHLRGEDVANLQVRLARLGFNPGRVDGIFGPLTEAALKDFESNAGLPQSGVLSRLVFEEVVRLSSATENRIPVTELRDLGAEGISGDVSIGGNTILAQGLADGLGVDLVSGLPGLPSAAIESGAGLAVAVSQISGLDGLHLHYWQGYMSSSNAGRELGQKLASALETSLPTIRVETSGMSLPVLRETPMTALVVEHGDLSEQEVNELVTVFQEVLRQVIHK